MTTAVVFDEILMAGDIDNLQRRLDGMRSELNRLAVTIETQDAMLKQMLALLRGEGDNVGMLAELKQQGRVIQSVVNDLRGFNSILERRATRIQLGVFGFILSIVNFVLVSINISILIFQLAQR